VRRLPSVILFLGFAFSLLSQNPHGADFKVNCASCHASTGWEISADYWTNFSPDAPKISKITGLPLPKDTLRFTHDRTDFPLTGAHQSLDCRACHETLRFSDAKTDCKSCHEDLHQQTVGNDCARCHTTSNWMVDQITELHQTNGFPLTGVHTALQCDACHQSASTLQFERIGNDCISCHRADFKQTTNPDHTQAGFSENCLECHDLFTPEWETDKVDHSFFPLEKGHEISDCKRCHTGGSFNNTPNNCFACHQPDFESASNPNHVQGNFTNDCAQCHTTDPDWMPAQFTLHDAQYFPIYSGKHQGQWTACTDCHTNPSNYAEFSCTVCHTNPETDDGHDGVNGYVYENTACLACHPAGDADNPFDHNTTAFPLTGAHLNAACAECHTNGYTGTPTQCAACHTTDYTSASNPNHTALNISTDCAQCHTTAPGWAPATFANHNDYYALNGAHAGIANDCAACHNGNYNNTPNTCAGCHTEDFNATTNPNHAAQQFPTTCQDCHGETAWAPSTFDHNSVYPLTGAHASVANDCNLCHNGNYTNTPNTCAGCHTADFNGSLNPNHTALNISTDCAQCHTTAPGWAPAAFANHNDYYVLNGAHAGIANDCAACHNGDYNNTPNTCAGCHTADYNATNSPNHQAAQFPTDCAACHGETNWVPANFNHDGQYFPIYSGKHQGEWTTCADCHTNPANYSEFTCTSCHTNPETDEEHDGVGGYTYNNSACLACHPTGDADNVFDHNTTAFPLTGAHLSADCMECHSAGFEGTSMQCASCHTADYNGSANPNHTALGISTDCAQCHTTAPGWAPASFPTHANYYVLNGAHAGIANDCASCHNGDYNNTPNTCAGCHTPDYNASTDPNHPAQQFPTTCQDCHSETAWSPSAFDHNNIYPLTGAHAAVANDCNLCHNGNYNNTPNTCAGCHTDNFNASANPNHVALGLPTDCALCHTTAPGWAPAGFPIHNTYYALNGAHAALANDCATCHNGDYNNTPNTCAGCHTDTYNATTNPNHVSAGFPTDCAGCHGENVWVPANFNHDAQYFPIYSGEHNGEWSACTDCHSNPANYAEVTCTSCHTNPETDDQHDGVGGYSYSSPACLACHPTGDADVIFDHNSTSFALSGAHLSADCLDCHSSGFQGTSTQCASCHTAEFNASANPNHVALGISTDCAQCHNTTPGWAPAAFPTHNNYYALNGAHAGIANDCAACHNGDYNNTPNNCAGCHTDTYNATTNPNHAASQFPTTCQDCHSETAWTPSTFNHSTVYPLTGAHATIANDCNACHNGNYTNTPNTCAGCHTDNFNASANPNHVALNLPTDCAMCHTTAPGWEPAGFPIHANFWPLNGAHAAVANDCAACHNGDYNNTPNNCAGCHTDTYNATTNPNHAASQFPTTCQDCHSETAWTPSTFNHSTVYPLTGAHATIANDCNACHNGNYTNTPNTCAGCHTDNFNASANPNHVALNLPTDCAMCHTTAPGWEPAGFPIHANFWPLNGAHATVANDCAACHNGDYNNTPNNCAGCHTDTYNATMNPNHAAAQFPTTCQDCHSETAWTPSTFNHNTFYPLNGAHATIANDCNACHNGNYTNTPNTCAGCHTDTYNATTNPNHATAQFPTTCQDCHSETAWTPSTFDHNAYYPLTGAHIPIANDCAVCHNGNYTNTPNTCAGCHTDNFNASTNPNHVALGIPTDCAMCHTTTPGWEPAGFPIHANYWPLNGAHAAIASDCATCHNGNYNTTPNTCAGCHTDTYNATSNPDHEAAQFPNTCQDCHSETAWTPSTFDHNAFYPLTGAHIPIANDCNLCHNGNYTNTPNTCAGCHTDNFNAAANPNHVALSIPTDCAMCHSTAPGWEPAGFPIHANYWVLNGAHASIANDCAACHNGNYNNTPNTCAGCHTDTYNSTTNPNHATAQFPTTCQDCHSESAWVPSTFDHGAFYPLTGAHASIANDCNACHNGNYTNTPNTCAGCHTGDYNTAVNPNHISLGLPTDCAMCHTTDPGWMPASFPIHANYWPLNGAHAAIANDCAACHNGNYNNTPNTCYACHTANYNNTNNPDHQSAQFPTTCQDCHSETAWVPSTFNHDQMYFPIFSGRHEGEWNTCSDCHTNSSNYAVFSCIDCHEHDDPAQVADDHQGVSGYQYNSQACFNCHPQGEN
jgi:hypothetical protein